MTNAIYIPPPVQTAEPRPFWSVMIPTYKPGALIEKTLRSVLEQDPGPSEMQIEVVDDASGDPNLALRVRAIAGDRVTIYCQPHNVGLAENWNTCIDHARGKWVHILHQDDMVLPGFYDALRCGVDAHRQARMAITRHVKTDHQGHWQVISPLERETPGIVLDWAERQATFNRVQCPAVVVRRDAYEAVGGFAKALVFVVDWEMWFRIAAHFPVFFDPRILACYRMHSSSETGRLTRSAETTRDVRRAIAAMRPYFPKDSAASLVRQARFNFADAGLNTANAFIAEREHRAAWCNIVESARTAWFSPFILARVLSVCGRLIKSCIILHPQRGLDQPGESTPHDKDSLRHQTAQDTICNEGRAN